MVYASRKISHVSFVIVVVCTPPLFSSLKQTLEVLGFSVSGFLSDLCIASIDGCSLPLCLSVSLPRFYTSLSWVWMDKKYQLCLCERRIIKPMSGDLVILEAKASLLITTSEEI